MARPSGAPWCLRLPLPNCARADPPRTLTCAHRFDADLRQLLFGHRRVHPNACESQELFPLLFTGRVMGEADTLARILQILGGLGRHQKAPCATGAPDPRDSKRAGDWLSVRSPTQA